MDRGFERMEFQNGIDIRLINYVLKNKVNDEKNGVSSHKRVDFFESFDVSSPLKLGRYLHVYRT